MMKRAPWFSLVFLPALVVPNHAQTISSDSAKHSALHTIVAMSGDTAPQGGAYASFAFFNDRLNERGAVAFDAVVGPPLTLGIFEADGDKVSAIAFGMNPNPAKPSFGSVMNPFVTSGGDVVFDGGAGQVF